MQVSVLAVSGSGEGSRFDGRTGADGTIRFDQCRPGLYEVTATLPNRPPATGRIPVQSGGQFTNIELVVR